MSEWERAPASGDPAGDPPLWKRPALIVALIVLASVLLILAGF